MSEIKRNIKENADGSFTITDEHSTADIIRWLLTQDSKEVILDILNEEAPQRTWVGLTRAERFEIEKAMSKYYDYQHECKTVCLPEFAAAIEAKLKEKNTRQDGDCKHCVNGCHACDARRQSNVLP